MLERELTLDRVFVPPVAPSPLSSPYLPLVAPDPASYITTKRQPSIFFSSSPPHLHQAQLHPPICCRLRPSFVTRPNSRPCSFTAKKVAAHMSVWPPQAQSLTTARGVEPKVKLSELCEAFRAIESDLPECQNNIALFCIDNESCIDYEEEVSP